MPLFSSNCSWSLTCAWAYSTEQQVRCSYTSSVSVFYTGLLGLGLGLEAKFSGLGLGLETSGLGLEAFGLVLGLGLVFLALALFKAKVKVTNILPNTSRYNYTNS